MKRSELADWVEQFDDVTLEQKQRFTQAAAIIRATIPRPLESAPRDGTWQVLLNTRRVVSARWKDGKALPGHWIDASDNCIEWATHYLPLPEVEG